MTAVYGLSLAAATLVATMAALGLIDYLFRLQDSGLRIIASLFTLGTLRVDFLSSCLQGAGGLRFGDVDLARRVQRQFPNLEDRLVSAVEFFHAVGRRSDRRLGRISSGGRGPNGRRGQAVRFRRRA